MDKIIIKSYLSNPNIKNPVYTIYTNETYPVSAIFCYIDTWNAVTHYEEHIGLIGQVVGCEISELQLLVELGATRSQLEKMIPVLLKFKSDWDLFRQNQTRCIRCHKPGVWRCGEPHFESMMRCPRCTSWVTPWTPDMSQRVLWILRNYDFDNLEYEVVLTDD